MALCFAIGEGACASGIGCIAVGDGAEARGYFQLVVGKKLTMPRINPESLPMTIKQLEEFQKTLSALADQQVISQEWKDKANAILARILAMITPIELPEAGESSGALKTISGVPIPSPAPVASTPTPSETPSPAVVPLSETTQEGQVSAGSVVTL